MPEIEDVAVLKLSMKELKDKREQLCAAATSLEKDYHAVLGKIEVYNRFIERLNGQIEKDKKGRTDGD